MMGARIRRYSESMAGLSQSQDSFIQRQQLDAAMADTFLEHLCLLDIDQEPITARNTSIVCTIGPASRSVEKLQEMIKAGMNVARLNFSHGSHEYHTGSIENVRRAVESLSAEPLCYRPVAIALDTKGPEIRTGLVRGEEGGEVELVRGSRVRVVTQDSLRDSTDASQIWLDYKNITRVVRVGGRVYVDDGLISLRVLEIGTVQYNTIQYSAIQYNTVQYNTIQCNTVQYNTIQYNTIQYNTVQYSTIQYNTIQYSTIQYNTIQYNTIQCNTAQYNTIQHNTIQYNTISSGSSNRFDEILQASDGIMVAIPRNCIPIEEGRSWNVSMIPAEKVFLAQKMMIGRCNSAGKPVICATQMLESMRERGGGEYPCEHDAPVREGRERGERRGVLEGAEGIILWRLWDAPQERERGEGEYPVEAVSMMHSIAREAEAAVFHKQQFEELRRLTPMTSDPTEVTAIGAVEASFKSNAGAIIVLTTSGRSAQLLSRYRPRAPIIAVTRNERLARQAHLYRGIFPALVREPPSPVWSDDVDQRVNFGMEIGKVRGFFRRGDMVIVVTGWSPGSGHTNIMRAVSVP
ncbi:pyruvate kinase PKM-like [Huso huso]|uniref:Pyruvate kinase n=1 Tax=Huso huso TaxID=61971 RepID=A0ABR0YGM1_HUSHU